MTLSTLLSIRSAFLFAASEFLESSCHISWDSPLAQPDHPDQGNHGYQELPKERKIRHCNHRLDPSRSVIKQRFKLIKSQFKVVTYSLSRWSNRSSSTRLTPGPPLSFFTLLSGRSLKTSRSLQCKIVAFFIKRAEIMLQPLNSIWATALKNGAHTFGRNQRVFLSSGSGFCLRRAGGCNWGELLSQTSETRDHWWIK